MLILFFSTKCRASGLESVKYHKHSTAVSQSQCLFDFLRFPFEVLLHYDGDSHVTPSHLHPSGVIFTSSSGRIQYYFLG